MCIPNTIENSFLQKMNKSEFHYFQLFLQLLHIPLLGVMLAVVAYVYAVQCRSLAATMDGVHPVWGLQSAM